MSCFVDVCQGRSWRRLRGAQHELREDVAYGTPCLDRWLHIVCLARESKSLPEALGHGGASGDLGTNRVRSLGEPSQKTEFSVIVHHREALGKKSCLSHQGDKRLIFLKDKYL